MKDLKVSDEFWLVLMRAKLDGKHKSMEALLKALWQERTHASVASK
jgi:hypothetical protein